MHWEPAGRVFSQPPAWVVRELGMLPWDLWAPDVSYFAGRYHVYYAASYSGTNHSLIGLATNVTLDPSDPAYGWRDEGMVLRSLPSVDAWNALDPDVVFDREGRPWLSYGSYWTGIRLQPLDPATGKLVPGGSVHAIASRPPPGAVEAPSIVRHEPFYYLFTSWGGCCQGVDTDYRVMVGRSPALAGPYLDRDGVPLAAGGGTQVQAGYGRYAGTGHSDVLQDEGGDLFVHHYYDREDAGRAKLSVRPLTWADGWPVAGVPLSDSHPDGVHAVRWSADDPASWRVYADPLLAPAGGR